MKDYIYLDNAAAMQVDEEMLGLFVQYALEYFPNPEAEHIVGRDCRNELLAAGKRSARTLTNSDDYDVFWTASATEAMNIALSSPLLSRGTVITTRSEHPSMSEPLKAIEGDLLKVNMKSDGTIDLDDLEAKLSSPVTAVALHLVQNETGAVQDLCAVRELVNKYCPSALLIADTVQAIGKIDIPWRKAGINIAFVGGHKLGVSSGGALLYHLPNSKQKVEFKKHLNKLRRKKHLIGRVDPPIALTLADAIEKVEHSKQANFDNVSHLNSLLRNSLKQSDIQVEFLLSKDKYSPYIASFFLPPYQGQILVRMLAEKGVMVSEGSACEAVSKEVSTALLAMGISKQKARSVLRVSFGFNSDESDVNAFLITLKDVLRDY